MPRTTSSFVCQQCGYSQVGWAGKCPNCGSWGSLVETIVSSKQKPKKPQRKESLKPLTLISTPIKVSSRLSTKIPELDRVLGGGLVPGQVILIAGEPGIGKSTLLLQVASQISEARKSFVLYVSGEESIEQVGMRARRLGIKNENIKFLEENDVDSIINAISTFEDKFLEAVIVDSIQTMTTTDLSGVAGSIGQVRECTFRLVRLAKEKNIPIFLVGHITKEGTVAGPAVLMHIVDTVVWFEGDKTLTTRLLRAVKNRFGPTDEVGIFEMKERGLFSLNDPQNFFLTKERFEVAGSALACILEGTRPILVEVQSLVVPTKLAFPKRISQGMDLTRIELMLAVLIRRCGLPLYEHDCFVNITGGISLRGDPSADLATCLSIASSYFDKPLPKSTVAIGEVGLLGDIREVSGEEKRIKEAKKLGFKNVITSKSVRFLNEAIKSFLKD